MNMGDDVMLQYLTILMKDPNTAIGAIVSDRAPYGKLYDEVGEFIKINPQIIFFIEITIMNIDINMY